MRTKTRILPAWLRHIVIVLICVMGLHSLSPMAFGRPIPSGIVSTDAARTADLAAIQQLLEQKVVQHRLQELGFSSEEINMRISRASDAELHQLVSQSEVLMAGGDGGTIVVVLVIILLVFLILRIVDNTPSAETGILAA